MNMELKRGVRSRFYIFFISINILTAVLGYTLLITIDNMHTVTFEDLLESVYTVYTQFGMLLFSVLIIMQFYVDYKEKTILFYKALGFSPVTYFLSKVLVTLLATVFGSLLVSLLITLPFGKSMYFPVTFLKIESVMIYYTLIASILGFIIGNLIFSFFANLLLWIVGIVVASTSPYLRWFAYYDASTADFKDFLLFLDGNSDISKIIVHLYENYIYNLVILVVCIIIVRFSDRRWIKNGI